MGGIEESWRLAKASLKVLRQDKELIVFPVVSGILCLAVTATFYMPDLIRFLTQGDQRFSMDMFQYARLFVLFVILNFIIFFCNTALIGAAMIRMRGGSPTLGDGIRIAESRIGAILGYSLIASTVGIALRFLSDKSGWLGRTVAGLGNMAWNIATYLVVPVLAYEKVGPIEAVKKSATLLKKTWGEQITGNFALGALISVVAVVLILLWSALAFAGLTIRNMPLMLGSTAFLVITFIILGIIHATLSGIYAGAIYLYAATGETEGPFDPDLLRHAFRPK